MSASDASRLCASNYIALYSRSVEWVDWNNYSVSPYLSNNAQLFGHIESVFDVELSPSIRTKYHTLVMCRDYLSAIT